MSRYHDLFRWYCERCGSENEVHHGDLCNCWYDFLEQEIIMPCKNCSTDHKIYFTIVVDDLEVVE